jgi:hypothetical protein
VYIALKNSAYSNWVKDFNDRLMSIEDGGDQGFSKSDPPSMIRISLKHRLSVDYAFKIQRFPSKEIATKIGSKTREYMDSRIISCNGCGWTESRPSNLECVACKEFRWPMKLCPEMLMCCPNSNCECVLMELKLRCSTHKIRLANGRLLANREYWVSVCKACGLEIQPYNPDIPLYSHNATMSYDTSLFYTMEQLAFLGLPPSTYMRSTFKMWEDAKTASTDSVAYACFTSLVDYVYAFMPQNLIEATGNFPFFSPQYGYHPSILEGDSGHKSRMPARYL